MTARLSLPAATPMGAEVVACHEDACASATLPRVPAPGQSAPVAFPHGEPSGLFWAAANGSLELVVNWVEGAEGDHYTIRVLDTTGTELASLDETAQFTPGGTVECPGCPHAELGGS